MVPLIAKATETTPKRVVVTTDNDIKIYIEELQSEEVGLVFKLHSEFKEQRSHDTFVYIDENGQLQSYVKVED